MDTNIILATDSYKLNHWHQYPADTQGIYSYFESRVGAEFPYTVFFGLQAILQTYLEGVVIRWPDLTLAAELASTHFGSRELFNSKGWHHIIEDHGGMLPLRIKAVPEGTPVPTGNVLMTVENTCEQCYWLTNAVESLLTHVWYPSTVATLSRTTFEMMAGYLDRTAESRAALPFMLHDFGYRGASSHESAALGGLGHLVNGMGTDTLPAMLLAMEHYGAGLDTAFSVPATEHSVMTALGEAGEFEVVDRLFEEYPTGILSVVADSYDIYRFVEEMGTTYKERILARDGKLVVRPDSVTPDHKVPSLLTVWIVNRLYSLIGGTVNSKGYKVLDPHVGVLWGDGIDPEGIEEILLALQRHGFSAENMVFGMGGGLLQKVNRDTQRFAFKCSAAKRNDSWVPVYKKPLDVSKASKRGRMALVKDNGVYRTVGHTTGLPDELVTVFEDGVVYNTLTFAEVRANAALAPAEPVLA